MLKGDVDGQKIVKPVTLGDLLNDIWEEVRSLPADRELTDAENVRIDNIIAALNMMPGRKVK